MRSRFFYVCHRRQDVCKAVAIRAPAVEFFLKSGWVLFYGVTRAICTQFRYHTVYIYDGLGPGFPICRIEANNTNQAERHRDPDTKPVSVNHTINGDAKTDQGDQPETDCKWIANCEPRLNGFHDQSARQSDSAPDKFEDCIDYVINHHANLTFNIRCHQKAHPLPFGL